MIDGNSCCVVLCRVVLLCRFGPESARRSRSAGCTKVPSLPVLAKCLSIWWRHLAPACFPFPAAIEAGPLREERRAGPSRLSLCILLVTLADRCLETLLSLL
jgi:hypothetical protein